jgi:hypothetical protein
MIHKLVFMQLSPGCFSSHFHPFLHSQFSFLHSLLLILLFRSFQAVFSFFLCTARKFGGKTWIIYICGKRWVNLLWARGGGGVMYWYPILQLKRVIHGKRPPCTVKGFLPVQPNYEYFDTAELAGCVAAYMDDCLMLPTWADRPTLWD